MLTVLYFPDQEGPPRQLAGVEGLREALGAPGGYLWADLLLQDEAEARLVLEETLRFHHLTVEDCLSPEPNPPKLEEHDSYLFIIFHALEHRPSHQKARQGEMGLYLGGRYLVTCHHEELSLLDEVRGRLQEDALRPGGADGLLHAVLDALVDAYLPYLAGLEDDLESLEEEVLAGRQGRVLDQILHLRRSAVRLRRIILPELEVMARLSRHEFPELVRPELALYFRDIYDHLVRTEQLLESLRDIMEGVLNTYLSAVSNRLNEVMRVLTAIATVFLPLTLLAGVYGMNFSQRVWPSFDSSWGFPAVVAFMIASGLAALAFFRHRGWL